MDRARQKTDKMLRSLERRVEEIYESDPSLLRIQKKYDAYMEMVDRRTHNIYMKYKNETDIIIKNDLKKEYIKQVEDLTLHDVRYKSIINEMTKIMARVNQDALNLINNEMPEVYVTNYNQVAVDCKKVGIEVNG